jgi:hypothetical protein
MRALSSVLFAALATRGRSCKTAKYYPSPKLNVYNKVIALASQNICCLPRGFGLLADSLRLAALQAQPTSVAKAFRPYTGARRASANGAQP